MNRFSCSFALALAALLLAIATINVSLDPYAMFRTPRLEGFNKNKPAAAKFVRVVKPYHLALRDYKILITGSSRIGLGLTCERFTRNGQSCYNAAVTGGRIYEALRAFQQRPTEIKTGIVALEFFTFINNDLVTGAFKEKRYPITAQGNFNQYFPSQFVNDIYALLLSRQTLTASQSTWNKRSTAYVHSRSEGMLRMDNWGSWRFDPATLGGFGKLELANRQIGRFTQTLRYMKSYHYVYATNMQQATHNVGIHLAQFDALLHLAYANGIAIKLFIPPSHIHYWVMQRELRFQPLIDHWKTTLVKHNEEIATLYGQVPFPIFDFSGANPVTNSAPPQKDAPDSYNHKFSDTVHFSRSTGEKILDIVLGPCVEVKDGFGSCLSKETVQDHLLDLERRARDYERENATYLELLFSIKGAQKSPNPDVLL